MNDTHRLVGSRLRRAREAHGWTLRQLSAKAGLSFTTIHHVESGADARFSTMTVLAATLGVSLDQLAAPLSCGICDGIPPAGFTCRECGTDGPEVSS